MARERPGLVVFEEDAGAPCGCSSSTHSDMICSRGGGTGHAVLEALVAVGLQQSCRVVCVRRRTLSDIFESMLVVSGLLAGSCWPRCPAAMLCMFPSYQATLAADSALPQPRQSMQPAAAKQRAQPARSAHHRAAPSHPACL